MTFVLYALFSLLIGIIICILLISMVDRYRINLNYKILSERHGGNIQIANNKAGGACVTVKINCNES